MKDKDKFDMLVEEFKREGKVVTDYLLEKGDATYEEAVKVHIYVVSNIDIMKYKYRNEGLISTNEQIIKDVQYKFNLVEKDTVQSILNSHLLFSYKFYIILLSLIFCIIGYSGLYLFGFFDNFSIVSLNRHIWVILAIPLIAALLSDFLVQFADLMKFKPYKIKNLGEL